MGKAGKPIQETPMIEEGRSILTNPLCGPFADHYEAPVCGTSPARVSPPPAPPSSYGRLSHRVGHAAALSSFSSAEAAARETKVVVKRETILAKNMMLPGRL
ncbi:hypothetical protein PRIPAC_78345 [Pristionchus pacificus]|uniref:Uncharacterized protein n=1 Tax=Pristionchus pacificus TaxID=54126 RepID=A0A2A6CQD4_PRIPA|nr:hypothetical protein PRIPAC_78345 [Pristionchus pacificus]|eukprot:PDM80253.1 hypothetical protein PRIPAC_32832 [Pristionchus pacificus]